LSGALPPLRERSEDFEILAEHFVREAAKKTRSKTVGPSRAALAAIKQYDWPGNLLELRNRIFRAVLFSRAPHRSPRDLDLPKFATAGERLSLEQSRDRAEKETLTGAARELRISRMTRPRLRAA